MTGSRLLRRKRPRGGHAAEPSNELSPSHRSFLRAALRAVGYRGLGCMGTGCISLGCPLVNPTKLAM
jgi:hypothetical protein